MSLLCGGEIVKLSFINIFIKSNNIDSIIISVDKFLCS